MPDLSAFPITARRPANYPDRLQLTSLPMPSRVKISIAPEEIGLPPPGPAREAKRHVRAAGIGQHAAMASWITSSTQQQIWRTP
jgi:hypothetical protein